MSSKRNRVTIPTKVIDHLYNDEEFFREVTNLKKISLSRFPKNDQWVSEDGFNMVFALAGYGAEDLRLEVCGSRVDISSKEQLPSVNDDDDGSPKQFVSHGVVNRGIARRSFKVSYFISEDFDTSTMTAKMDKGLLTLTIPRKDSQDIKVIEIKEI